MPKPAPSRKILRVSWLLRPINPAEVARVEVLLGAHFPEGYEAFITTYGEGCLSTWVRIHPPAKVAEDTEWPRGFLKDQIARGDWFWDRDGVLPPMRASRAVVIGNTMSGDTIVFHPDDPDLPYALPRHKEVVYRIGRGLGEAFDWLFLPGNLTRPFESRAFEPEIEREEQDWSIDRPLLRIRRSPLGLGVQDAVIHDDRDEESGDQLLEQFVAEFAGTVSVIQAGDADEPCEVTIVTTRGLLRRS